MTRPDCVCKHRHANHSPACTACACQKYQEPSRRTRGDGSLFRRDNGLWVGRVELPPGPDGKRRSREVSSKDRNVAIAKLRELRSDVLQGRIAVTGSTTVEKWLGRWLEDIHGRRKRPTTYRDYETTIRLYINPHIGSKRLDKLTPQHVRQMEAAIESDRCAQKAYVLLRRALHDAVREGLITRNVADVAEKPSYTAAQRAPLTSGQAKALLRSSIDLGDPMATRWAAALFLGARQGELLGLQWDRVDLDAGLVDLAWQLQQLQQVHGCGERHDAAVSDTDRDYIAAALATGAVHIQCPGYPRCHYAVTSKDRAKAEKAMTDHLTGGWPCGRRRSGWCPQRRWDLPRGFESQVLHRSLALTRPKTLAGTRVVPIPAPLWALLERHPRGGEANNPHSLVWHHPDGRPVGPRDDHANWKAALKAAGLPAAPLHVARNTTATLLMEAGVPEQIRMSILGHTSITAHRGYAHVDTSMARAALENLNVLLPG